MERRLPSQTMQQHSLPSFSGCLQGGQRYPKEEAGWAGPLPLLLPLPRPFFVNVYLTLPARKSIYYLSWRPEGQQMKLPVTRTSFGPHLRRGPKLSRYFRGPAGLNFPGCHWASQKWTPKQLHISVALDNNKVKLPSLEWSQALTNDGRVCKYVLSSLRYRRQCMQQECLRNGRLPGWTATHFCSRKFNHWYSLEATCFSL